MNFLLKYWKKYKLLFIASVSCVGFEAICDLIQPRLMSSLIDNGVSKLDLNYVFASGLLMLFVTAIGAVFACTRNILSSRTSQNFSAELRQDLFEKIHRLSVSDAESFDGGSLITRSTNDVTQLTNFVNGIMRIFFKAPIVCIGSTIMAASLNIRTLPIVLTIVFIAALSITMSMRLSYPIFAKVQAAIDRLNTTVREYLIGIRLVKAFGRFKYEDKRFNDANKNLANISIKANKILAVFSPINSLAANTGIAVIIIFGARWVGTGEMEVGTIVAFVSYMTQILTSVSMISNMLNVFVRTKASYTRIAEIMNLPDSENQNNIPDQQNITLNDTDISLTFNEVSFEYPLATGEKALSKISFNIKKSQTLGVIGSTGSGKSTLAVLALGFYDATSGEVRLGDKNINDLPKELLRRHVAIVPQTPSLFSGTIRDNICFGNQNATDEEIISAAKAAQAYEFIEASNDGFNTTLGQGGINLSGGQKQRISIARALVGRPDVLILDDCTSALDSITESKVLESLKQYFKDLTCILISQRISTVARTNKILVLDYGCQVGFGNHDQLMDNCQVYREIYISQIGKGGAKIESTESN